MLKLRYVLFVFGKIRKGEDLIVHSCV